jgi:hypothetical protein
MAFGLAALLITMGIIAWLMSIQLPAVSHAQKDVQPTVQGWAGNDPNGVRLTDTYSMHAEQRNGATVDFHVDTITPGSPMQTHFGLQPNDLIIAVCDSHGLWTDIKDINDETMAKAQIQEACQYGGAFKVIRGNSTLTLIDKKPK